MTIAEARKYIRHTLSGYYPDNEIRNFTDLLLTCTLNYSKIEIRMKGSEGISQQAEKKLIGMLKRLESFEPVQYVLGETIFFDLPFLVSPHVLIPRPETEELVSWLIGDFRGKPVRILDIGTGSGCIAVTLAKKLPLAVVSGCDIDKKAVETAGKNAKRNLAQVPFFIFDVLHPAVRKGMKYDVLVSNPPYVRESEKAFMHPNVLHYEPHRALFVPDDDPLLFYRAIAILGLEILEPGGFIYCEINENLPAETRHIFLEQHYTCVDIRPDINGRSRMLKAIKPEEQNENHP